MFEKCKTKTCQCPRPIIHEEKDPGGGVSIYKFESELEEKLSVTNNSWLVAHVNTDPTWGHSVLVVEGIQLSNSQTMYPQIEPFVGYYHITGTDENSFTVKTGESDHHYLKQFYQGKRVWRVNKQEAVHMISQIQEGESIPYSFFGGYSSLPGKEGENCASWVIKQLANAGIDDKKIADKLAAKPKKHAQPPRLGRCSIL